MFQQHNILNSSVIHYLVIESGSNEETGIDSIFYVLIAGSKIYILYNNKIQLKTVILSYCVVRVGDYKSDKLMIYRKISVPILSDKGS